MRALRELESELQVSESADSEERERLRHLAAGLRGQGVDPGDPVGLFFIPGRIEVLGKHTDYAGGRSLVAATEQGIWMAASPRADRRVRMSDLRARTTASFSADRVGGPPEPEWSLYPRTVVRRMVENLDDGLTGAEIVFESNLPLAAGLSSSSALVVATYMALAACNRLQEHVRVRDELHSRELLAAYLGAVEGGREFATLHGRGCGVGTEGGNQDHTAILCCGRGEIRQYSYLPTRLERVLRLPARLRFAVAVSGVVAEKTGEAQDDYNRASRLARELTEIWNRRTGRESLSLGAALASNPAAAARFEELLIDNDDTPSRDALLARLRHFVAESGEIVPGAARAFESGDLGEFGEWVDQSQALATRLLHNQVDETVWLAAAARELGAVAASAFGAGYGGSVWALVSEENQAGFLDRWSARYARRFPARKAASDFIWTGAGGAAVELQGR
jgi:galactokinase